MLEYEISEDYNSLEDIPIEDIERMSKKNLLAVIKHFRDRQTPLSKVHSPNSHLPIAVIRRVKQSD